VSHFFWFVFGFLLLVSYVGLELQKYLHGEEITVNCPNGWAVVTVNGCSVGGVKVVNGKAKNHYPKGLRTL
jgi:NOL1/NOP2/fmu family ribosome biogenesis protein